MSISKKVKSLVSLQGKKNVDLSKHLGLSSQRALTNKYARESFTSSDLIRISEFLECELAFITKDNQKITLTSEDIREKKKNDE